MSTLITVLHVIVCLFLMLTVLLQSGKSGGMGAAFGGGNAATVFGGSGASTFLRKLTAGAATVFMITSMVLAFIASHNSADALEKFGESQAKLAADKEAAKAKALQDVPSSGSGAGSSAPTMMMNPTDPSMGSAADMPGNHGGGTSGSAVTPNETPVPAGATDAKPNPATPSGMSAVPAEKPAPTTPAPPSAKPKPAPAKPSAPAPATTPAPAPSLPPATGTTPAPNDSSPSSPTP